MNEKEFPMNSVTPLRATRREWIGLAPVFTLATDMIVGTAPPERAGAASAISETGSELGGAQGSFGLAAALFFSF